MMNRSSRLAILSALLVLSLSAQEGQEPPSVPAEPPAAPQAEPVDATPAQTPAEGKPEVGPEAVGPVVGTSHAMCSPKVLEAIGPLPEGKAMMVFFRPSKFIGAATGFIVREGTQELGRLRNGNYFSLVVEPGPHAYGVHSETSDIEKVDAEAGKVYFFQHTVGFGILVARPHMAPSNLAVFEALLPKIKKARPLS